MEWPPRTLRHTETAVRRVMTIRWNNPVGNSNGIFIPVPGRSAALSGAYPDASTGLPKGSHRRGVVPEPCRGAVPEPFDSSLPRAEPASSLSRGRGAQDKLRRGVVPEPCRGAAPEPFNSSLPRAEPASSLSRGRGAQDKLRRGVTSPRTPRPCWRM